MDSANGGEWGNEGWKGTVGGSKGGLYYNIFKSGFGICAFALIE